MLTILEGYNPAKLKELADKSVNCVVTSPPYFGLRDYGLEPQVWGGDVKCEHVWNGAAATRPKPDRSTGDHDANGHGIFVDRIPRGSQAAKSERGKSLTLGAICKCGAWRGSLGLEPTPEMFVERIVEVLREVWRVLRDDGTLWLNLGDSYANDGKWGGNTGGKHAVGLHNTKGGLGREKRFTGLKPKDLIGIPWRVAFALQADGWYLRQDIIWSKPNPMPESVSDRCTKAHEYIFLLTKNARYYYDQDAVLEPVSPNTHMRLSQNLAEQIGSHRANGGDKINGPMKAVGRKAAMGEHGTVKHNASFDSSVCLPVTKRNKRSVWTVATQPYSDAHFATFPEALIEPCILAGCPERGLVLDPFAGSGTVGAVALKLGRRAVLIEANPTYIELIKKRCSVTPNLLLAAAGD